MRVHTNHIISSFLLLLILFIFGFPFSQHAQLNNLQVTKFSESRNLGVKYPIDILTDKNYKYWIATANGLMEYDGNRLKTYHIPYFQNGIYGSDNLYKLLFENDSILWVCHMSGVARFNIHSKKYELIKISEASPTAHQKFVYSYKDSEGKLFFISTEFGVMYYNQQENNIKSFKPFNSDSLGFINKITEIENNRYYLAQSARGFYIYSKKHNRFLKENETPADYVWIHNSSFKKGVSDHTRIKNDHYVSLFSEKEKTNTLVKINSKNEVTTLFSLPSNRGRNFYKDSFGRLWFYGFADAAEIFDPLTQKIYSLKNDQSLSSGSGFTNCFRIFEDHENNIWLCTNMGLLTLNLYQNNIEVISKDLPHTIFTDMEELNDNTVWFGSLYNGIYEYNYLNKTFKNYNLYKATGNAEYNQIWQIYKERSGKNIWIAHFKGQISRYEFASGKFYHYNDSIHYGQLISIDEDNNGNIYCATESGVIMRYNKEQNKFKTVLDLGLIKEGVEINDFKCLDSENFITGTSEDGLLKVNLNSKAIKVIDRDAGNAQIKSNLVAVLEKSDNNSIYAGTSNGILRYNIQTEKLEGFIYNEDFNLGIVDAITRDERGNIIFIGGRNIYSLNWQTKDIIDLSEKSNMSRKGYTNVYYSNRLKKLFVLTEESINEITINPHDFQPKIKPIIYSLDTYSKAVIVNDRTHVFLDNNSSSFRINFGSSTYKFKDDLEYFYDFNNEGWHPVNSREVSFNNLAGSIYPFKLKVVYKGNRNIFAEKLLFIHLDKKFYQTYWFYFLILCTATCLLYLIYRIRVNRLLSIERVRLQLSRDLHDDMGSTLSTINILSTMALRKIDQDSEATKEYLRNTSRYSLKMMDSMDDIVWSLNPANDKMKKIIYRMREFATTLLEPRNITFDFKIDEKVKDFVLQMAIRRDFFLIFKEALNNAAKYSQCSNVKVDLGVIEGNLILTIEDNGVGMDLSEHKEGNGLNNMRKRAELLNGHLSIESNKGKGTRIILKIRIKNL